MMIINDLKIEPNEILHFKMKYPSPDNDVLFRFAENAAKKMQKETISPAIKEKSPLYCISEFGKCHIKEIAKDIGERYNVIFDVSSLGAYKDMYAYYMLCLADKVDPGFEYNVTFRFDRIIDLECIKVSIGKAKYFLIQDSLNPLNEIRLELQEHVSR